ncbi:DoxX family membrane protein [Rhodobacteraceae bacterium D3-12]|nr:DoxX family membrane protein [Rhodobacteraceae bacterium D3-12]
MNTLFSIYNSTTTRLEKADWLVPTLARFLFAAVLLMYFWKSALTKIGDGVFGFLDPTSAYFQIFPKLAEAYEYDTSKFGLLHWLIALAGTWAEFILPLLLLLGLFTRLAALGMIGFLAVQTLTDLYGHGVINEPATIGAWFDNGASSLLMDQRSLWLFLLVILVIKGAGPLSLDRLLKPKPAET